MSVYIYIYIYIYICIYIYIYIHLYIDIVIVHRNIYIKSGPVEKRPYFLPTSARTKKGSSMSDQLPHETKKGIELTDKQTSRWIH